MRGGTSSIKLSIILARSRAELWLIFARQAGFSLRANHLLAKNQALTVTSKFAADPAALHVLPIDVGGSRPALVLTLKNRTLNRVAERVIACARGAVKWLSDRCNG